MANTKISNLTSAGTLTGSEVAPIVQSGSTVKATAQNIANLAIPSQSGQNGKYLTTDGITTSWGTVSAGAAVYSSTIVLNAGGSLTETNIFNNTGATCAIIIGPSSGEEISINYFAGSPNVAQISWIMPVIFWNNTAFFPTQTGLSFFRTTFSYYSATGVAATFSTPGTPFVGTFYVTGIFN